MMTGRTERGETACRGLGRRRNVTSSLGADAGVALPPLERFSSEESTFG